MSIESRICIYIHITEHALNSWNFSFKFHFYWIPMSKYGFHRGVSRKEVNGSQFLSGKSRKKQVSDEEEYSLA